MKTLLVVKMPDGKTRRVQFLGGNDLDDPDRPAGVLNYSFDKRLIEILKDSTVWGKIAIPVLMAFTSKYAVSIYENIAQLCNLSHKKSQTYSLEEFRALLGVPPGKYKTFGELNKHVVKPAIAEVNALAGFRVVILPIKQGKKVKQVNIGWWNKAPQEIKESFQELQRTKLGRRARTFSGSLPRQARVIISLRFRSGGASSSSLHWVIKRGVLKPRGISSEPFFGR